MGSIIEEIIKENTILARLVAADQAAENGEYYLEAELRDADECTAELPYGDGDGDGSGDGDGDGSGDGYGSGYGSGYGGIEQRQY